MKFPYPMLRDFVDTRLNAEEVGDLLTMAGFELEGIEEVEGDPVLDIKVMSNRGDGLSVFGLSREVLAKDPDSKATDLYSRAVSRFPQPDDAQDECDRFGCRLFRNVQYGDSPEWMQKRLRQAGMRPISLLVDLTNYVMLEVGQPLHAYDHDLLHEGRIVVRKAKPGEKLVTLDGTEHELNSQQMMICDGDRPVGAAGVMGGLDTEVTASTKHVLLEAAHFQNRSVRRTRKQMGLNTEASYRFERSVDPESVSTGLNRVAELLAEIDGGSSRVPGLKEIKTATATREAIELNNVRACKLLGMEVTAPESKGYLERLGFAVNGEGPTFQITPPTWRPDIVREEDVIEEIGRVHGYDRIPETLPKGSSMKGGMSLQLRAVDGVQEALIRAGLIQILSHTLRDLHSLDDSSERIGPRVPAGPDTTYLRNSLLPSLVDAFKRNGGKDLHLFEIGKVFSKGAEGYREVRKLAILSQGVLMAPTRPKEVNPSTDFFSLKGFIQAASKQILFAMPEQLDPRFHPTRSARLTLGTCQGIAGQIHPDLAVELGVPDSLYLAEVELTDLAASLQEVDYHPLSRNPAVKRDITVGTSKALPYESMATAIHASAGSVLEKLTLIDVYEGPGVPEGEHAISFGLQLRKVGENFTDEEANQVRDSVVSALAALGAKQR